MATPDISNEHLNTVLFSHTDFVRGFLDGKESFHWEYLPGPLTEEEMLDEVDITLSKRVRRNCKHSADVLGLEEIPYLQEIGFVLGLISEGLEKK